MSEPIIELAVALITSPAPGTAFAIDARTALTAWHCLEDDASPGTPVQRTDLAFLNGDRVGASFLRGDPVADWAILRLDSELSDTLRPIPLRRDVATWEDCRCLGFPASAEHPEELGFLPILATVSGEAPRDGARYITLQSNEVAAHLDPRGLSGGPLVPRSRPEEAVGIMSRRLLDPATGRAVGGVLFACPTYVFADEPLLGRHEIAEERLPDPPDFVPQALLESARAGQAPALTQIGQLLREAGLREQAERWLREAALIGSATAAFQLGILIDPDGQLIQHDRERAEEALDWFRRAATGGDVYGATTMGIRLRQHGRNDAALPWLEEAVERGDAMAAHTLALVYEELDNDELAEHWHRFAATRGDVRATTYLGRLLGRTGRRPEALNWLQRVEGDAEADDVRRGLLANED